MSTPKASTDDLQDEGFVAAQFGQDESTFVAYLTRVLVSASLWVEQKCTPVVYALLDVSTYAGDSARRAEVAYCSAVLFRRRYAQVDAAVVNGLNKDQALLLAELRKKEADALQDATYWLGESLRAAGVDDAALYDGSAMASGTVETGRYPLTTGSAVS